MCENSFFHGGIYFPNFTRYACCNPCCSDGVNAQVLGASASDDCSSNCCCRRCCPCCCRPYDCCSGSVSGASDSSNSPCPCRGGW